MRTLAAGAAVAALLPMAGCGDDEQKQPAASKAATTIAPEPADPLARMRATLEGLIKKKWIASFDRRNGTAIVNLTKESLPERQLEGICLNAYTAGEVQQAVVYAKSGKQVYTCP